jgi:hypothetical protein
MKHFFRTFTVVAIVSAGLLSLPLLRADDKPAAGATDTSAAAANTLTAQEKKDGFVLLFNGKDTDGWRIYKQKDVKGWEVIDGVLTRTTGGAGDLITRDQYANYELVLDWRIGQQGNSGIIYRCDESGKTPWQSGPEYQLCDNAIEPDPSPTGLHSVGSCYDLYPPTTDATKPVGEWNTTRILIDGNHVEHWLNGKKVVSYEFNSDDFNARVAKSKFKVYPQWGQHPKGHLALQDHGHKIEFRNMKLRPIESK